MNVFVQGVIEEVKDDYFHSKVKNPDGEVVGTTTSSVEGNKLKSVSNAMAGYVLLKTSFPKLPIP